MVLQPTALAIVDDRFLQITWNDGVIQRLKIVNLRAACPCATCREKERAKAEKTKGLLPVLTAAEAQPLKITRMNPVGNYAYNIDFSDGHGSGLFTIEMLRSLDAEISASK
jgi:DUF971 family protein